MGSKLPYICLVSLSLWACSGQHQDAKPTQTDTLPAPVYYPDILPPGQV